MIMIGECSTTVNDNGIDRTGNGKLAVKVLRNTIIKS